jgi:hypothetical protein
MNIYSPTISGSLTISGSIIMTGSINTAGGYTGSLFGTASQAISSSYALSASYAPGGGGGAAFPYTGSATISGSLGVTGPTTITGSLLISGSINVSGSINTVGNTPVITTTSTTGLYNPAFYIISTPTNYVYNNTIYSGSINAINAFTVPNQANLLTVSASNLEQADFVWSPGTTALTGLHLPNLKYCNTINTSSTVLTNLNLSSLRYGSLSITNASSLPALNLPNLVASNGITLSVASALTSLDLTSLANCAAITITGLTSLTSINLSSLINTGAISLGGAFTSLTFTNLQTIYGNFTIGTSSPSLTSISFPSIVRIANGGTPTTAIALNTSNTAALTTFTLGSGLLQVGTTGTAGSVVITSAALTQASVDNILVRLAALDGTNGTTTFSSRVVTITGTSSTPSATGLAAKTTLQGRGCTVTNN